EKTDKEHHQEKILEVNRSAFISFIKEKQQQNPSILRNLISSENAYKPKNSKVRLYKDEYFGKSGSKLTTEIEDGLHIYTT
ncbi:GIY-YIG nuclease family protein, partial [Neisseria sp. P0001.S006]